MSLVGTGNEGVQSGPAVEEQDWSVGVETADVEERDVELEVLVINGRDLNVNKYLPSKSKLNIYVQKFKLPKPVYKMSALHENITALREYRCSVEVEGKVSFGTGTSKKNAEAAAARRYCNNIFLCGGNSLLLGKEVSASKVKDPSNRKRKDKIKMEKFLERKRASTARVEDSETSPEKSMKEDKDITKKEQQNYEVQNAGGQDRGAASSGILYVPFDLERAGGPDDCEIIQLGYSSGTASGSSFILPRGKIDKIGSRLSHKITVVGKVMLRDNIQVKTETMLDAGNKFIRFLQDVSAGRNIYLVCHGNDVKTLLNNFAKVNLDKELVNHIAGSINSLEVFSDDAQFDDRSKSLSNLKKSKNLAEEILGDGIAREELVNKAHDAEFDALLLGKVWAKYLASWSPSPPSVVLENYMDPSSNLIKDASHFINKIGEKRRRKMKTVNDSGVIYFNGWL